MRLAGRQPRRGRRPDDVRAPRGVDGDVLAGVGADPAEVGGVHDHRVDDQRPRAVVLAHAEPVRSVGARLPRARHLAALALELLVGEGRLLAQFRAAEVERQSAVLLVPDRLRSVEPQRHAARIGARMHDDVVLEPPAIAVEHEVDAGTNAGDADAAVGGDPAVPVRRVVPHEVVHACRERFRGLDRGRRSRALDSHAQSAPRAVGRRQREHGLLRGEEERRARRARQEEDLGIALADVRLEVQRDLGGARAQVERRRLGLRPLHGTRRHRTERGDGRGEHERRGCENDGDGTTQHGRSSDGGTSRPGGAPRRRPLHRRNTAPSRETPGARRTAGQRRSPRTPRTRRRAGRELSSRPPAFAVPFSEGERQRRRPRGPHGAGPSLRTTNVWDLRAARRLVRAITRRGVLDYDYEHEHEHSFSSCSCSAKRCSCS